MFSSGSVIFEPPFQSSTMHVFAAGDNTIDRRLIVSSLQYTLIKLTNACNGIDVMIKVDTGRYACYRNRILYPQVSISKLLP
jgi:hypothetical protein